MILITITASGYNRIATFYLTVNSDYDDPKVMTQMKLQSSISGDYYCVIPQAGEMKSYLNKNFTVKDINNDGFDKDIRYKQKWISIYYSSEWIVYQTTS